MREAIENLKNKYQKTHILSRDEVSHQLAEGVSTDEEYCTLMWLLGVLYQDEDNKNAATYCCLRANEIWCMNQLKPKKRRSELEFTNFVMDEEMESFIQNKIAFMKDKYKHIKRQLLYISFCFGSLAFLISYFFLKLSFGAAVIEWVCFSVLSFWFTFGRSKDRFYILQSQASGKYLSEEDMNFDKKYL